MDAANDGDRFNQIPDPAPDFAETFNMTCREMLMELKPELQQIAIRKMEGYTNKEIANEMGCVEESVRRKVMLIRSLWKAD